MALIITASASINKTIGIRILYRVMEKMQVPKPIKKITTMAMAEPSTIRNAGFDFPLAANNSTSPITKTKAQIITNPIPN